MEMMPDLKSAIISNQSVINLSNVRYVQCSSSVSTGDGRWSSMKVFFFFFFFFQKNFSSARTLMLYAADTCEALFKDSLRCFTKKFESSLVAFFFFFGGE